MKKPVVQKDHDGCGAACTAFVVGTTYENMVSLLGKNKAVKGGFPCKELVRVFNTFGYPYLYRYLKQKLMSKIYQDGVIVFIKRSEEYPTGHFLVRYQNVWMDPWINYRSDEDVSHAKAGLRKRLPGTPIYALFPV